MGENLFEDYKSLINAVSKIEDKEDKELYLEFIGQKINAFPRYVDCVYNMQVTVPIIYARYEGQDLRDKVESLDGSRRSAHERAIAVCQFFNRLCNMVGAKCFCPDESADRYAVADFVGRFVYDVYLQGILPPSTRRPEGMDGIIEVMEENNITSIPVEPGTGKEEVS